MANPRRAVVWVVVGAAFLVGVVVGAAVTASLASRASYLLLAMTRFGLSSEQSELSAKAYRDGDPRIAALYARCAVVADAESKIFHPENNPWNATFPVMGVFASRDTRYGANDEKMFSALARARLAHLLELNGDSQGAAAQYEVADGLVPGHDREWWRSAAQQSLSLIGTRLPSNAKGPSDGRPR